MPPTQYQSWHGGHVLIYVVSKLTPMTRGRRSLSWVSKFSSRSRHHNNLNYIYTCLKKYMSPKTIRNRLQIIGKSSNFNAKWKTCNSRFIGICRFRSQIISETALSWLEVREYGRAFKNFLVRVDHSSI